MACPIFLALGCHFVGLNWCFCCLCLGFWQILLVLTLALTVAVCLIGMANDARSCQLGEPLQISIATKDKWDWACWRKVLYHELSCSFIFYLMNLNRRGFILFEFCWCFSWWLNWWCPESLNWNQMASRTISLQEKQLEALISKHEAMGGTQLARQWLQSYTMLYPFLIL